MKVLPVLRCRVRAACKWQHRFAPTYFKLTEVQDSGQLDNRISIDGASKLATALRHNTSLLTLDLSGGAVRQGYRADVIAVPTTVRKDHKMPVSHTL